MAWAEAGEASSYLGKHPGVGAMIPDYRGGIAFARGWGHHIRSEKPGFFFETNADAVFVSRFSHQAADRRRAVRAGALGFNV